ncbi:SDR family NAD(P)-dependent oxidoreductase [Yoonia sp.]|uniref:SDR family NAD(P)-dependent oxidoreductase n=1 Tax=Yoonia sp. TaxID=2212373 RepID=UPI00391943C2
MTLPQTPSFRLDGRRALVTGASSGIGLACAVALADAGAAVTCVARRKDALEDVARQIGGRAVPCDITDVDALAGLFDTPYQIVVNAAGLARHGPALDTAPDDFDAVMAVNLRAAYFLSQAAARGMVGLGGGTIIHISSQMGHVGGPDRAVYCASKHAIEGMVKAMALEWGPHRIRINTICPTFIRTPLTEKTFTDPDRRDWLLRNIALGRPGEVTDLMGAVVFLTSDAAAMVTGTALKVDGGWTAA